MVPFPSLVAAQAFRLGLAQVVPGEVVAPVVAVAVEFLRLVVERFVLLILADLALLPLVFLIDSQELPYHSTFFAIHQLHW